MTNHYPGKHRIRYETVISVRKAFERSPQRSARRASADLSAGNIAQNTVTDLVGTYEIQMVQM